MNLFYIFLILILLILILNFVNKYLIEYFQNDITKKEFDDLMINNKKSDYNKLYNVSLGNKIKIQRKDCFRKCDYQNCVELYDKIQNYEKCKKCQEDNSKCYKDLITYGGCDNCSKYVKKNKCNSVDKYGCPDYNNLYNNNGVKPYFIEVPSKSSNSPFDTKCVFCWNIRSFI